MSYRLIAIASLAVTACVDGSVRRAITPTDPPDGPQFAVAECDLETTDADALAAIDALITQVGALEEAGTLSAGNAAALRNHLLSARDQLLSGRPCPAAAQLRAFRRQVTNFVGTGALPPADAEPLLDDVGELVVSRIAFATRRDGNYELYTVNLDGSGLTRLTEHPRLDAAPDWSPDATQIAFFSARDGVVNEHGVINNGGVYVMNADGSGVTRLVFDETRDDVAASEPQWSPDGTRILFSSGTATNRQLYVINVDGTGLTAINPSLIGIVLGADWSPDGARIVVAHAPILGAPSTLYVMNVDGTGLTPIVTAGRSAGPAWSPDGRRIAFSSLRDGHLGIYVINPDGTNEVALTSPASANQHPNWSPDGRMLVFVSDRDGNDEIYVMKANGSGQTRLTDHPGIDVDPAWRP